MVQSLHIMIDNNMSMADVENQKTFADLGLSPEILKAIEIKGYTTPSPIQVGVIPLLLKGEKDIIGQAQTGTGKTAAFALPLLERLHSDDNKTQAIILTPTRELAIQVANEIESFAVPNSPSVTTIYGGNSMFGEIAALKRKPTIVVGTPGRIQHHIRNKNLKLDDIKYFVLDEADEMLNFGFRSEIESILDQTPTDRKVLLFSATMPDSILSIVNNYMGDYDTVKVAAKEMTNENISQKYYCLQTGDKFDALCRIMEVEQTFYSIIFCRTKREVDALAAQLKLKHLDVEGIHGDIDQKARERILHRFKTGHTKLLVATDVAARGIDVSELNFVVNYTIPESYETYTHRIGRTGRAGNTGTAITFVTPSQVQKLKFFERSLKVTMQEGIIPEVIDVIAKKQQHLIEKVEHIVNNEDLTFVLPMAEKLLEEGDAKTIIAALLKTNYDQEFNADSYAGISKVSKADRSGAVSDDSGDRSRRSGAKRSFSKNSHGTRVRGTGSQTKSKGGRVGGGSAKKFGSSTDTKKQFGDAKPRNKFAKKPKSPGQYKGAK